MGMPLFSPTQIHPIVRGVLVGITAAAMLFVYGCTHLGFGSLGTNNGCLSFANPQPVVCHVAGRAVVGIPVVKLCQRSEPDRWIAFGVSGAALTIVGGECFALFDGDR